MKQKLGKKNLPLSGLSESKYEKLVFYLDEFVLNFTPIVIVCNKWPRSQKIFFTFKRLKLEIFGSGGFYTNQTCMGR
jgi:hypothetical protein